MKNMSTRFARLAGLALVVFSSSFLSLAHATTFPLPPNDKSLLGNIQADYFQTGESLASFAQRHDVGFNSILNANPGLTAESTNYYNRSITLPTLFMLPPVARKGIVINLPEMRMYYFPSNDTVMTFPVGIGRVGKTIPITVTAVTHKVVDPVWTPTPAIREFNRIQGIELPKVMPAGPDNPLGPYAIYLRVPTYLIHSTIFPESIGKRASFGCIRMNQSDIKEFFPLVKPGTPVVIVNIPSKVAWEGDQLFLEVHPPLEEHSTEPLATMNGVIRAIEHASNDKVVMVDWQLVSQLTQAQDGMPHAIGVRVR